MAQGFCFGGRRFLREALPPFIIEQLHYETCAVLLFCFCPWINLMSPGTRETQQRKMPPSDWPKSKFYGTFSQLMIDVEGATPLWAVSPLGKRFWVGSEKQTGQARRHKLITPLVYSFCLVPALRLSSVMDCNLYAKSTLYSPRHFWSWNLSWL